MASNFQEAVAMNFKFCHGKILLHIIDHCTRLPASTVVLNKNPDTIIKAIFKIQISVYGSAEKFLTDNGGEFAKDNFIQLCESFGITVKTTAAESPWNNGLVEHHNLILSGMLDKILHENKTTVTLILLGPSMLKILSVTSMDSHLTNYQLAPTQNYHLYIYLRRQ